MNKAKAPRLITPAAAGIVFKAPPVELVAEVVGATVVVVRAVVEIEELLVELELELEPVALLLDAPLVGTETSVSTGVALFALIVTELPEAVCPLHVASPAALRPQVSPAGQQNVSPGH